MPAPLGNNNHGKAKRWQSALERAMARRVTGADPDANGERSELMMGIDAAADQFVACLFENKELGYFKEFGDRIDGKAAQSMELTGSEGGPVEQLLTISFVNSTVPAET